MTTQRERLEGVVRQALKEAAAGEPFGYSVEFTFAPQIDQQGQFRGFAPSWFVLVTIRNGIGEPDIGNGFPVPGVLPADETMRNVAVALLRKCRDERDAQNQAALADARAKLDAARRA